MTQPADYPAVNIDTCASEPIHIIGRVQSFGFLLAFSSDWIVAHASQNCADWLGRPADDLIGLPASEVIALDALHDLRSRLQTMTPGGSVDRIFNCDLLGTGTLFDVAVHMSGRSVIVEAEPSSSDPRQDYVSYVRPLVDRMRATGSLDELCELAARQLRGLTKFDRVMVYRFEGDGAGEVIAESHGNGVDSFRGLHFPASDIPAQARRLYTRNLLRIITDIDDPTSPILPAVSPQGDPLDLSMSGLRAVSPIHIEYLRNMGVKASMSVSILRNGELWGLFACHHYAPLQLNYAIRTACELFGEFFSFLLEQADLRQVSEQKSLAIRMHDTIMSRVQPGATMIESFDNFADAISQVIQYDAIAGWIDGELVGRGDLPGVDHFQRLARFLNTTGGGGVWHTDSLTRVFPAALDYADCCAGLMALPVSRSPRDYIILFRKPHVRSVSWAGNPEKSVEVGPNGARLTPRKSFELWQEERRDQSAAWTAEDVANADSLRITLLEVILRMNETSRQEQEKARRKQDVLIAELNHRVRNILNLIRGLVAQSRDGARTMQEFTEIVGSRIQSLARAHDQVTKLNWGPASVQALLQAECEAYLHGRSDRLVFNDMDALVEPQAFSTLALVFHEMMTNSCKYGALSDRRGRVSVALTVQDDGSLCIDWSEHDGPTVSPPSRKGFGSTIITTSIPHELDGTVTIDYPPGGVVARFCIPAQYVVSASQRKGVAAPTEGETADTGEALLSGTVLVLEDNLIIAMEAEDLLQELGADECLVAGNASSAIQLASQTSLSFAMLDVNLGSETSEAAAAWLKDHGVPFIIVSGYGDKVGDSPAYAGVELVMKPFSKASLLAAIARAMGGRK